MSNMSAMTRFNKTLFPKADLEGVMLETDPEIPLEKLRRFDADYIFIGEARGGVSYSALIEAARRNGE